MKVLSIKEPFATLIKDDVKIYETRSFKTNYRGEIYIHASKAMSKSENVEKAMPYLKSELNPGCILCKCNLVDCIYMTEEYIDKIRINEYQQYICGEYKVGRYAWILENIEPLSEPIVAKGKLRIWNYEEENEKNE